eukprot:CAMPEP_0178915142 /NCGR_PEP_ID=MMETSP0786-20121207/11849_1 /TAXON_ID=186022 /ORGANISM="Thalassionema frauenfeldii, Strain CCMP 1798" /LENGTH=406 /DNA_ID=CAMNT_0020588193 /DNA_START=104 /DNA_END=1324 /DNA_ORIENTATION=+
MKPLRRVTTKSGSITVLAYLAVLGLILVVTKMESASFLRKTVRGLRDLSNGPTADPIHMYLIQGMGEKLQQNESLIWDFTPDPKRPVMNTFFHPLSVMQKDYELIAAWKHAWTQAGWNPRILSLKDVQKHPEYATIRAEVEKFGYNEYETMCYLRHFAMANEGGWMVDFDAFPLYFHPDIYGHSPSKFISYGGGVPSLLGGTKQEWERIAHLMLLEGIEHHKGDTSKDKFPFSDMLALFNLREKNLIDTKMETGDFVNLGMGALAEEEKKNKQLDCEWLQKNVRVIHGAHRGVRDAGWDISLRAVALGDAMQLYHEVCNGPDFYTVAAIQRSKQETTTAAAASAAAAKQQTASATSATVEKTVEKPPTPVKATMVSAAKMIVGASQVRALAVNKYDAVEGGAKQIA